MTNAIEVKDLWWKYEGNSDWSLKGIDLTVEEGEFLGIVGPSGAGKTTLCLSLVSLIPFLSRGAMKGSVKIDGVETTSTKLKEIVKKVGIVFQDPEPQFVTMSVEDEIAFPMENRCFTREEMIKRIDEAMRLTKISKLRKKYPHELSGGQKQRVAIASFLALRPDIMILDEPTSDLDPVGKTDVFSVISDLKKDHNITFVVVEHNTEELAEFADRIVLLKEGKILREGSPNKFFTDVKFLKNSGVFPPQVTELGFLLNRKKQLPITLNQSKKIFKNFKNTKFTMEFVNRSYKSSKEIIKVSNLKFEYPDGTKALNDIDLEIGKGEYIAIIGQNSSGKTTLVKHMVGLLKPKEGSVEIYGKNTRETKVADVARKVGYVYQNPDHQLFCHTVYEEVAFGPRNLGVAEEKIKSRVMKVLKFVDLEKETETEIFYLGKGQRQRLAVAATLVMEPEVLIVDEPTTGQDMRQSQGIMSLLDDLNKQGKTIIIITHNMRLVAEHARRTIMLFKGKIVIDGPTREVFSKFKILKNAYTKPPQITILGKALFPRVDAFLNTNEILDVMNFR